MNLSKMSVAVLALGVASAVTAADSMRCGTDLIETDQTEPVLRPDVIRRCGPPDGESDGDLMYEEDGAEYVLRFNDDDELVDIIEEIDQ